LALVGAEAKSAPGRKPAPIYGSKEAAHKKDAVIGLAILVLLILLWRLMTHSEQVGSFGPTLKTNIFGALGVGLANSLRTGGSNGNAEVGLPDGSLQGTSSFNSDGTNALSATSAPPPLLDGASNSIESIFSNAPIKIIGGIPVDATDTTPTTPVSTSPDAAALAQRLAAAGAKSGDIQISLFWTNYNDLDLHCVDPMGVEIFYSHKRSEQTGGELDVDRNAGASRTAEPIENVYWPEGGAPPGIYRIYVVYYDHKPGVVDATPYSVRVLVKDRTYWFPTRTIVFAGRRRTQWICTIQYTPTDPEPTNRVRFLHE
jgi:hypothetical protein